MKFAVDCMLGKLGKWLKILGFDAAFFNKIEDADLLVLARKEGRILLTRDNGLLERAESQSITGLFIASEEWPDQVEQVLNAFGLRSKARPHSRCIECNIELKSLTRQRARNLVTPFVFERADTFALCPRCARIYWRGTHFRDMNKKIESILDPKKSPGLRRKKGV